MTETWLSSKVSYVADDARAIDGYVSLMVTRIGPRRPRKLYLQEWREKRGISQEQQADRVDTTKATISRFETGSRKPTTEMLAALADSLEIEPQDFYRHPDTPSADELLRNAPKAVKEQAITVLQAMIGRKAS